MKDLNFFILHFSPKIKNPKASKNLRVLYFCFLRKLKLLAAPLSFLSGDRTGSFAHTLFSVWPQAFYCSGVPRFTLVCLFQEFLPFYQYHLTIPYFEEKNQGYPWENPKIFSG